MTMDAKRWQEIKRIYESALETATDRRDAFLNEACAGDDSLRDQVKSLLECRPAADEFMKSQAMEIAAKSLAQEEAHGVGDLTGQTFLHYRITGKIGKGGMGVVYKAEDVRLGRAVALKFLSGELAGDQQALERFQREARAASALNHPGICTLHDIGEQDGQTFLVMEHLSGETLAERLYKGPLPLDQALDIGARIAEALDAAHKQGIIHRDLKPGNVMLTKTGPKLLDFGLAKLKKEIALPIGATVEQSASLTGSGVIMGTVPYMAPEQLEGKDVDARTDLWALGVILYEMISGKRAFDGPSQASLIAAILEHDPAPLASVRPHTPPLLGRAVKRCLAKGPDARWNSAHDIADELRWIRESGGGTPPLSELTHHMGRWKRVAMGSSIALVLMLAAAGGRALWHKFVPVSKIPSPIRTVISVSNWGIEAGSSLAISPDGNALVFPAIGADGQKRLYLRRMGEYEPTELKGTEGAGNPFFSPDGEWVAFTEPGKALKKVALRGGTAEKICDISQNNHGGVWGNDNQIIFCQWPNAGLWTVPAVGGIPVALKQPPPDKQAIRYMWPDLLPGAQGVLFTIWGEGRASIAAFVFRTGEVRPIIPSGSHARYLPTGHLIYASAGNLCAVAFDEVQLQTRGVSNVVVENIQDGIGLNFYQVSPGGTLAYLPSSPSKLVMKDRSGNATALKFGQRFYRYPSLSPDGQQLAVCIQEGPARNVFVGSVLGETLTRLTFGVDDDVFGLFARDGKQILFTRGQEGKYNIYWTAADGSGKAKRLTDSPNSQKATSWRLKGDILLFNNATESIKYDIWQMQLNQPNTARPWLNTPFNELEGAFSRNGDWVAYQSNEEGAYQIYVQAYPGPGLRRRISVKGGQGPVWNPSGDELFYRASGSLMMVRVINGNPVGAPESLFPQRSTAMIGRDFDVTLDGRHFIVIEPEKPQIHIVSNWFEELKAKVPTGK
jgi:serine/threonine protein kinase/Tol biopolymer transport system component